jgi:hypothetical protein
VINLVDVSQTAQILAFRVPACCNGLVLLGLMGIGFGSHGLFRCALSFCAHGLSVYVLGCKITQHEQNAIVTKPIA